MYGRIYFLLILLFSVPNIYSQLYTGGCVDSTQLKPGAYCQPDYEPVCACDGKTYRNLCFAQNEGITSFNNGICENMAIDVNPNPVFDLAYITILLKVQGNCSFYIFDHYGREYLYRSFYDITEVELIINMYEYEPGPYIFIVRNDNDLTRKKMIKQISY